MAFTKTPEQSTYQTKMINLVQQEYHRGTAPGIDQDYVNCFIDINENKKIKDQDFSVLKRSGCTQYIASVGASSIRGLWYNEDFQKLYYAVGSTLHIWDVVNNVTVATLAAFFGTTTGDVGFCDYLYDSGLQVVIATDGTTLKQITDAEVVTQCVDADMPVHVPTPVFLDGYLFLLKAGTSDIYNSDLNNPMSWTPGDFISAEISPDIGRRIAKLNNYIVVFSSSSIEYFWDAANATGSPLQRNDTPVKFNGYLGGYAQWGNKIYFMGNTKEGQPSVFALEDFKIEELASSSVIRYLAAQTTVFSSIKAAVVNIQGKSCYVVTTGPSTYTLDLSAQIWSRWNFQQTGNFPITAGVNIRVDNVYRAFFALDGASTIYTFRSDLYQDNGVNFTMQGQTDNQYFDTYNQKFMHNLIVWCDRPGASSNLSISYSDDDYQTFSFPRTIDLDQELPSTERLGRFRRRAFRWSYTDNYPMRLLGLETSINIGQH